MPSFTSQVPNLRAVGPVVELRLALGLAAEEAFRRSGAAPPTPVAVVGMVDTGASGTVIQQGLPAQLQLNPVGFTTITTPSSTHMRCYRFVVRLLFPNNVVFETTAIEAPLQGQHIQCLVGRDVLSQGVLIYIGYSNLFSLSF